MEQVTIANTEGFLALAKNAEKRNRSVHIDKLKDVIDPQGVHVMCFSMVHNDCELRTRWFVKIKGTIEAEEIWLDTDFDAFNDNTKTVDVQNLLTTFFQKKGK